MADDVAMETAAKPDRSPGMKIAIRPHVEPQRDLDVTDLLISTIARELGRLYGGDDWINRAEAELHLERMVYRAGARTVDPGVPVSAVQVPACPGCPRRASAAGKTQAVACERHAAVVPLGVTARRTPLKECA
jgi:hypothetical protein